MSIKVAATIEALEVGDKELSIAEKGPRLVFKNHWNRGRWVVIELPDGSAITVDGIELVTAARKVMKD